MTCDNDEEDDDGDDDDNYDDDDDNYLFPSLAALEIGEIQWNEREF